jgi:hypothetical protein
MRAERIEGVIPGNDTLLIANAALIPQLAVPAAARRPGHRVKWPRHEVIK